MVKEAEWGADSLKPRLRTGSSSTADHVTSHHLSLDRAAKGNTRPAREMMDLQVSWVSTRGQQKLSQLAGRHGNRGP